MGKQTYIEFSKKSLENAQRSVKAHAHTYKTNHGGQKMSPKLYSCFVKYVNESLTRKNLRFKEQEAMLENDPREQERARYDMTDLKAEVDAMSRQGGS